MTSVRIEESGKVLRLFPSEKAADSYAVTISRGSMDRFVPEQHKSQLGWLIKDKQANRYIDADGVIPV